MPTKLLIVDDEKDMLVLLGRIFSERTEYEVITVDDPRDVTPMLSRNDFDIVITDLKMPHVDGIQVMELVKQRKKSTAVIVMTAYGTIQSAIEATRKGAFDYITKPFRKERILHVVEKADQWQKLQQENLYLREKLEGKSPFPTLIGRSPAMDRLLSQIDRVAGTSATVLLTGESGTGKELAARAIHSHSQRQTRPFIPINCSTIPESIIESELFGHVKGSFTGAIRDKKALVEEGNHGTLFLDEIGDLSPTMQVKLLRLIQEGEYKSVGSNTTRKVDVRFIAATHQDLPQKIKKGEFREDLYYRLNVINIHMPPLRDRLEDIPLLAHHFFEKYRVLHGKGADTISRETIAYLMGRSWPGNIRELENVIERGVILAAGATLEVNDLFMATPASGEATAGTVQGEELFSMPFKEAKDKILEDFETRYINRVLARHAGNVSHAAKDSGLKRQYLHRLMREKNVDSKSFKKSDGDG
ncbi:MAG: sigma-54-dependent Fis family transcriptional regulator [Syntrophobacteraceae bacterium]|nr:sigma-54-dependent Fis family transcriptional regulator [Syntrophobacteraceae bacterium]